MDHRYTQPSPRKPGNRQGLDHESSNSHDDLLSRFEALPKRAHPEPVEDGDYTDFLPSTPTFGVKRHASPASKLVTGHDDSILACSRTCQNHWCSCPRKQRNAALWTTACCVLFCSVTFTALLMHIWADHRVTRAQRLCGQLLYSPAQSAISYEIRTFELGVRHPTPDSDLWEPANDYIPLGPPTAELDARWNRLWNMSSSDGQWITRSEAALMSNATRALGPPTSSSTQKHWVMLEVFHLLHCLDMVRMSFQAYASGNSGYYNHHPERLPFDDALSEGHVAHCIDAIRQSLMCHVDITPLVEQWDERRKTHRPVADMPHTCRSYERVREWAEGRVIDAETRSKKENGSWMDGSLEVAGLKLQVS